MTRRKRARGRRVEDEVRRCGELKTIVQVVADSDRGVNAEPAGMHTQSGFMEDLRESRSWLRPSWGQDFQIWKPGKESGCCSLSSEPGTPGCSARVDPLVDPCSFVAALPPQRQQPESPCPVHWNSPLCVHQQPESPCPMRWNSPFRVHQQPESPHPVRWNSPLRVHQQLESPRPVRWNRPLRVHQRDGVVGIRGDRVGREFGATLGTCHRRTCIKLMGTGVLRR